MAQVGLMVDAGGGQDGTCPEKSRKTLVTYQSYMYLVEYMVVFS